MKRLLFLILLLGCSSCVYEYKPGKEEYLSHSGDPRLTGSWRSVLYDFDILTIESTLPTTSFGYYFTKDGVIYMYDESRPKCVRYKIDGDTLYLSATADFRPDFKAIAPPVHLSQKTEYKFVKIKK